MSLDKELSWKRQPPSELAHHGSKCCEAAKSWFLAQDLLMDVVQPEQGKWAGPTWIKDQFEWGPNLWPLHWCEAVRSKTLDCGALSCLSRAIYSERGLQTASVQLIQLFCQNYTEHWRIGWKSGAGFFDWLDRERVYHEVVGLITDDHQLKLWDPSYGFWLSDKQAQGQGSITHIRVSKIKADLGKAPLLWGARELYPEVWNELFTDNRMDHISRLAG